MVHWNISDTCLSVNHFHLYIVFFLQWEMGPKPRQGPFLFEAFSCGRKRTKPMLQGAGDAVGKSINGWCSARCSAETPQGRNGGNRSQDAKVMGRAVLFHFV